MLKIGTKKQWRILFYVVPGILLIPLIAMQFTTQVDWSIWDFLVMGILLLLVGLSVILINSKVKHPTLKKIGWSIALLVFLLVWAELAVGIFGSPFAGS